VTQPVRARGWTLRRRIAEAFVVLSAILVVLVTIVVI
jgi:hypothetical protein